MATISENNVRDEFFFTESTLNEGVNSGALKPQYRSMHGNSYRVFLRTEVEDFAKTELPDAGLKAAKDVKQMKKTVAHKKARLEAVTTELNGIDARKINLLHEKEELNDFLLVNDPKTKAAAKKVKDNEEKKRKREQK